MLLFLTKGEVALGARFAGGSEVMDKILQGQGLLVFPGFGTSVTVSGVGWNTEALDQVCVCVCVNCKVIFILAF